jgi:hypothetical protein
MRKNENGRRLIEFWFSAFPFQLSNDMRKKRESEEKNVYVKIYKRYLNTFFPVDHYFIKNWEVFHDILSL